MQTPPHALLGVDFTCAPSRRKPLTVALGERRGGVVRLHEVRELHSLNALEDLLATTTLRAGTQGWWGGFDFPFGLPRLFVDHWAKHLPTLAACQPQPHCAQTLITGLRACMDRAGFQRLIDTWGQTWAVGLRPPRLPHRRTDTALNGLTSTSPLQTRYVPVGKMYFEGMARLVTLDCTLPGLQPPDASTSLPFLRTAFEAYPALLAHELLGATSYKNESQGPAAAERLLARLSLIDALVQGRTRLALRLQLSDTLRDQLAQDPLGDRLDAVLCLLQAAWAHRQWSEGDPLCGLPADIDPVEGWILSA